MWYCITLVILSKKTSRIRSRIVKGLVSVSSRLLGVSVSVSSRRNFPMSRSRLGLGHEGLVSIPDFWQSRIFRSRIFSRPVSSCVYKLSPRQLQCLVVWHCGKPVPTTAVSAERRGAVGHWLSAIWAHHGYPALTALVTRSSASHVQDGNAYPQVLERPGPTYLADFCRHGNRRSGMRSAETWKLHVPRARTAYGDRSFSIAGPSIWNSLPPAIRDPSLSSQGFRRLLNTHLFGRRSRR